MTVASQGWYVADADGSARGPFDRVDLIDLRARGALADDALVWTLELAEWVPLKRALPPVPASVTTSMRPVPAPPPPVLVLPARQQPPSILMSSLRAAPSAADTKRLPPTPTAIKPELANKREKLERLQWGARRLLARLIDFAVFSGIAWALIAVGAEQFRSEPIPSFASGLAHFSIVLIIGLGLLAIALEALSLALGGYTPGKFALGLRVIRRDGAYLHPVLAVQRSARVWLRGMAGWLPPFFIITMAMGLRTLVVDGRTRWDEDLGLDVNYRPMSGNRWFASFALLVLAYTALSQDLYRQGLWQLLSG